MGVVHERLAASHAHACACGRRMQSRGAQELAAARELGGEPFELGPPGGLAPRCVCGVLEQEHELRGVSSR
jgi:hypothetical protein